MAIYIKGIDLPTYIQGCRELVVYADGVVENYASVIVGQAFTVQKHGRLGDLTELEGRIKAWMQTNRRAMTEDVEPYVTAVLRGIQETPTIIPGDER